MFNDVKLEERRGDVMPLSVGEKGDIDPVGLDKSIGFDCVGGLDAHVNSLKVKFPKEEECFLNRTIVFLFGEFLACIFVYELLGGSFSGIVFAL